MAALRTLLKIRMLVARSWTLSWCLYRLLGARLIGPPHEQVWYFAYGPNMNDSVFPGWRGMSPLEWRAGHARGYRLRFNLEGRPRGRAAPANLEPYPQAEFGAFSTRSRTATLSVWTLRRGFHGGAIAGSGWTRRTRKVTRAVDLHRPG
jgi:hypothetical protein